MPVNDWIWFPNDLGNPLTGVAPDPNKKANDNQLIKTIDLLQKTSDVHLYHNFPGLAANWLAPIKNKAKATVGDLVVACDNDHGDAPQHTVYFQKSRALTASGNFPQAVWSVSHGFDQTLITAADTPANYKKFIKENLTLAMRIFMNVNGLTLLYSISITDGDADTNALNRQIGRMQRYGKGDQWDAPPIGLVKKHFPAGNQPWNRYWGAADGSFWIHAIYDTGH